MTRPLGRTKAPRNRRAFVLPLVILVVVLVSLAAAIMLERSGATIRRTNLQVNAYRDHHTSVGIQAVVNAWIRQYNSTDLQELIDEDTGQALEIRLADRTRVTVHIRDGQGTILTDLGAITDDNERSLAAGLIDALALTVRERSERAPFSRAYGPMRISLARAPREVIESVVAVVTDDADQRARWVDRIISEREANGEVTSAAVTRITNAVFTDREARQGLSTTSRTGLLAARPAIWQLLVTITPPPGDQRPVVRYLGTVQVSAGGGAGTSASLAGGRSFLSWGRYELDGDEARWATGQEP